MAGIGFLNLAALGATVAGVVGFFVGFWDFGTNAGLVSSGIAGLVMLK